MRIPWRVWTLWVLTATLEVDAGLQEDNSKVRKIPVSVSDSEVDRNETMLRTASYAHIVCPRSVATRSHSPRVQPAWYEKHVKLIFYDSSSHIYILTCKTDISILEETR